MTNSLLISSTREKKKLEKDLTRRMLTITKTIMLNIFLLFFLLSTENLFTYRSGMQKRSWWSNVDAGHLDNVQQGTAQLLATRRISILLRRDPRGRVQPRRGCSLCHIHHSKVKRAFFLLMQRHIMYSPLNSPQHLYPCTLSIYTNSVDCWRRS